MCDPLVTWDEKYCANLRNSVKNVRMLTGQYTDVAIGKSQAAFLIVPQPLHVLLFLKNMPNWSTVFRNLSINRTFRSSKIIKTMWTKEVVFVSEKESLRVLQR